MCLDGPANSGYEVDAVPVPFGPENPHGNAFTFQATLLETGSGAQRMAATRHLWVTPARPDERRPAASC